MVQCSELIGKIVRTCSLYQDGPEGPEMAIEFTDGTTFSFCFKPSTALEAKLTRDECGQPQTVRDYSVNPASC